MFVVLYCIYVCIVAFIGHVMRSVTRINKWAWLGDLLLKMRTDDVGEKSRDSRCWRGVARRGEVLGIAERRGLGKEILFLFP